jgi:hypothetical protein
MRQISSLVLVATLALFAPFKPASAQNTSPVLSPIGDKTVNEAVTLTFTATATDADLPAQTLTFSLDPGAPPGAGINASTGVFTWTPTECQSTGVRSIAICVTDNGSPPLSDCETFSVTVNEVNSAPVLAAVGNKTVTCGALLSFTATSTDADCPANTLTFTLDAGAPAGAAIGAGTGAFSWTPTEAQGPAIYPVTIRVTDNLTPALSDFEMFTITVSCPVVPSCTISGNATACTASTGLVYTVSSAVAGATFIWSIDGNGTIQSVAADGSSATVNAGAVGTFTLSVLSVKDGSSSSCEYVVSVESCVGNCPRTAGYWTQQCAQKGNGSTKFTVAEVSQIAECVDDHSALFSWASGTDFSSFCAMVDPPSPMNQRKQAKRQFATMLANVCTGQLGLIANNGDQIFLSLDTPIDCAGLTSATIGDVIGEVDGRLVSLEGQPLADPLVKDEYSNLIACLDAINNGIGIGTVCPEAEPVPGGGMGLARGVVGRVFATLPAPNPFTQSTYFALSVTGTQSKPVDVRVFDVAGKLVRTLARGTLAPGRHEMVWDGYSEQARRVPTGVYFLQSAVGGEKAVIRLLYLR